MNTRRFVEYADNGRWFPTGKKIGPAWHGWLCYTYDDPPKKANFVEPAFRPHKTYMFKTDHSTEAYKNPGSLQNPDMRIN
jgi:NADH:ubiquinone oxidoreductase subunit